MSEIAISPRETARDSATADADNADGVAARAERLKRAPDDMAMIRAAAELTRDLNAPDPRIYWTDFMLSALVGMPLWPSQF